MPRVAQRSLATTAALAALAMPAAAGAAPGTLDYRQKLDSSRGVYVEGSISFVRVRVRDASGDTVVRRRTAAARFRMVRKLPPGRYRVISYQRPCDGNCGFLDPPADRCARRVRVRSGGLTSVRVTVRPGRGCTMSRRALPARFPPAGRIRAAQRYLRGRGGVNSWALIDNWGRLHGFAPHRVYVTASLVKAMLLTSYLRGIGNRMPDAAERAVLGPDDPRLLERRRGHDLLPRRRRRALPPGQARGNDALLGGRLLGQCALQRRGPGALLQPHRPPGPQALARVRPRPPVLDRLLPALGLLALLCSGAASRPSSRAAGEGRRPASSCTRRLCSSAVTRGSRWPCSPTATPHTSTGRRRSEVWRSGSSVPRGARWLLGPRNPRRPARARPAAPALWTCTATARASA